jgi:RNA-directed DNA polymerase
MQQALAQVIEPLWEGTFSEHSYGFRPKRNCHQAVSKAQTYVNAGRTYIVDIDLEKFFDRVNHDYLMQLLSQQIKDKVVLSLVGKYLRAGIMIDGILSRNEEGTPQGSPLSRGRENLREPQNIYRTDLTLEDKCYQKRDKATLEDDFIGL